MTPEREAELQAEVERLRSENQTKDADFWRLADEAKDALDRKKNELESATAELKRLRAYFVTRKAIMCQHELSFEQQIDHINGVLGKTESEGE